jgi:opacity protein-like surface antigen
MPEEIAKTFERSKLMNNNCAAAKIIVAMVGAFAFGTPADAADLRSRPAVVMPPAVYDWGGFYVGANFGGVFAREDVSTPFGTFSTDPSGVLGGFQAGYNFLFSPDWLVGIEAEFDLTAAQGAVNVTTPATAFSVTSNHNWYDIVSGRLGYVAGPWLFYAKGGAAWMNADYRLAANSGLGGAATVSPNRAGWTIGGGAEYFFQTTWSAKLEYSFLDFGSAAYGFGVAGSGAPLTFNTRVHEVKAGVNYHWPSAIPMGRF